MNPTVKVFYVCDDVLQDQTNGKFTFLGIFADVVPPSGESYPFQLGRLCLALQVVGGLGPVPYHVEIVEVATQDTIRRAGPFMVHFPTRQQVVTVCIRILDVEFPRSGMYFVELFSQGAFVDDRILRLH